MKIFFCIEAPPFNIKEPLLILVVSIELLDIICPWILRFLYIAIPPLDIIEEEIKSLESDILLKIVCP